MRSSLIDRNQLLPYRYTAAHVAHETGKCPIRPMYRQYPAEDAAYEVTGQYMLGDALVVAPAFSPVAANGTVGVDVWLPPDGPWYDLAAIAAQPYLGGTFIRCGGRN